MIRKILSSVFAAFAFLFALCALIAAISDDFGTAMVMLIGAVLTLATSVKVSPGS